MNYKKILSLTGLIVFIYLLWNIGWLKLIQSFINLNLKILFIALILGVFVLFMCVKKWFEILKLQNIYVNYFKLFKISLIGIYYSYITPSKSGGILRSLYLKGHCNKSLAVCSSSFFIEKIFDILVIVPLALLGCFFLIDFIQNIYLYLLIFIICFFLLLYFFYSKKRSKWFFRFFYIHFIPNKLKDKIKEFFDEFYSNLPPFKKCLKPIIFSFLYWIGNYSFAYLIGVALGLKMSYLIFISVFPLGTIIGLLPISIAGLGIRELSLIFFMSKFGINPDIIVLTSLISMFFLGIIPAIFGFFISLRWKK